jgi:DNA-binding transcriptional LysR family regulator
MQRIKQSQLRVYTVVAEEGNLTRAAQRLNRTPSAVSMTLSQLEAELGQRLFEPEGKSKLTPFGRYVQEVASQEVERYDRAIDTIRAVARNELGRIDIAAVPSFAALHLPRVLGSYLRRYPRVGLNIRDDTAVAIAALVEKGTIDLGIASPPLQSERLHFEPLMTDPIGVVCSPGHALAALERPLRWRDLEAHTLISNGTCALIRDPEFTALLERAEIDVHNTTSLLALVAAGVGVTTLPQLAVPGETREVVFRPTAYDSLVRSIGILTPTDRSLPPAAWGFIATLRQVMKGEDVAGGVQSEA